MIKDLIKKSRNFILNSLNIIITLNLKKISMKSCFLIEVRNSGSIFIIIKYLKVNHDSQEIFLSIIDNFEILELILLNNNILIENTFQFFHLYIILINIYHCF